MRLDYTRFRERKQGRCGSVLWFVRPGQVADGVEMRELPRPVSAYRAPAPLPGSAWACCGMDGSGGAMRPQSLNPVRQFRYGSRNISPQTASQSASGETAAMSGTGTAPDRK